MSSQAPSTTPDPLYDLAEPVPSPSRDLLLSLLVPAALLSFLYFFFPYASGYGFTREPLFRMTVFTSDMEDWQHCLLVPMAIGVIVFLKRRELLQLPMQPSWLGGLPIIMLGLLSYWVGYRVDSFYPGFAALQLLIAGFVILLLGWQWMMALAFPWLFLTFFWPLLFLDNMVAFPLRLIMSDASVVVLNLIGIGAIKKGTAILSPATEIPGMGIVPEGKVFSVDVANPCSGIRSLFALMMVSALYGYFVFKSWWKRGVLFALSIPLAVLGNLFRILMLTFGTMLFGAEFAIGSLEEPTTFHMAAGFLVFAIALGGMLFTAWLLNAGWKNWQPAPSKAGATPPPPASTQGKSQQDDLY